jgi:hypothetical protein
MQQVANTGGKAAAAPAEGRLTLAEILDWLLEDKLVGAEPIEKFKKERRHYPRRDASAGPGRRPEMEERQSNADRSKRSPNGSPGASAWNTCTSTRSRSTSPRSPR